MSKIYVGVDGGGTGTRLMAAGPDKKILFESEGGPSNLCSNNRETVEQSLNTLFAGLDFKPDVVCIGSAGAEAEYSRTVLYEILRDITGCKKIIVTTDGAAALEAGLCGKPGISITAGTGSVCMGRKDGVYARAGGWGHVFSDEGSAYAMGAAAMGCLMTAHDKGETSILGSELLKASGIAAPDALAEKINTLDSYKSYVAGLASAVDKAAAAGDPEAASILRQTAASLANLCKIVYNRLSFGSDPFEVVCNGSVLTKSCAVRAAFEKEMSGLPCMIRNNGNPAAFGALLLAMAED